MTTPTRVSVVETHSSYLFFVEDRVFKLKKSLDVSFLDFRERAVRERAWHDEVALNRRLAPDVYLGVADVHGVDGRLADHLVVMRQMPSPAGHPRDVRGRCEPGHRPAGPAARRLPRRLPDLTGYRTAQLPGRRCRVWQESFAALQDAGRRWVDGDVVSRCRSMASDTFPVATRCLPDGSLPVECGTVAATCWRTTSSTCTDRGCWRGSPSCASWPRSDAG